MKIIILGAGRVGYSVAESLVSERNDITVIDTDAQRLAELQERFDLRGVVGNGIDVQVLAEAGAADTDLLIACAAQDETNLVCCKIAHMVFGITTRVARVRSSGFDINQPLMGPEGFAVEPNWWNPDDQPPFWGMWPVAEKLWIFPRFANMVVEFDPATGQMREAPLKLSHTLAERKEGIYKQQVPFNAAFWLDLKPDWWQTWPDRLGLMDSFDRSLLFVDRRTGQVTPHPACYIREDLARDMSAGLEFKDRPGISPFAASEGGPWNGLGDFIAYVSAGRHEIAPEQAAYAAILNNADGTCGQKIHEYILQAHR